MKNLLTQWKTKEKNRKIVDNVLLINGELAKLKDDAECVFLLKLIELIKKSSNLIRTGKEKLHWLYRLIFYSFAYLVKLVGQPCFYLIEDLINSLAIGKAESRKKEITVSFSE